MKIEFNIPIVFSLNTYKRVHWGETYKQQREIDDQVYWEIRKCFKQPVPDHGFVRMTFTIHYPWELDLVNRWAIVKVIEDAVTKSQLIPDDTPKHSEPVQPGWVKDKEKYVHVELEVGEKEGGK